MFGKYTMYEYYCPKSYYYISAMFQYVSYEKSKSKKINKLYYII